MSALRDRLEAQRAAGRKLLVPYLMGGSPDRLGFVDAVRALAARADVVEIGLPYSDPLMDGPVIATAGERAIEAGIGPLETLDMVSSVDGETPRVAMTYYNPIHALGEEKFCRRAAAAGISGLIVPDLPLEESAGIRAAAKAAGLAWIPLVAPTSSPERIERIVRSASGFVYAVSTLGVTGVRGSLSERAAEVVARCREATDAPVLIGIGVSNAAQASAAAEVADGVVIGSAIVRLLMDEGLGPALRLLDEVRAALDEL
jgi:tryptophan synthase alpha chain